MRELALVLDGTTICEWNVPDDGISITVGVGDGPLMFMDIDEVQGRPACEAAKEGRDIAKDIAEALK